MYRTLGLQSDPGVAIFSSYVLNQASRLYVTRPSQSAVKKWYAKNGWSSVSLIEDQGILWKLRSKPPNRLVNNLNDLSRAQCNLESEATCRISIEFMLIACKLAFIKPYPDWHLNQYVQVIPTPVLRPAQVRSSSSRNSSSLSSSANHPTKTQVRVGGRADWAIGYATQESAVSDTVLVAIEAKSRKDFSKAEVQLLAYLTVLWQLRINSGKGNPTVQGFCTDGERYMFLPITNDGVLKESNPYGANVIVEGGVGDLKPMFNFIVSMLETAARSKRELEEEIWAKVGPVEDYPEAIMEDDLDVGARV